jgi:hypothetical protein
MSPALALTKAMRTALLAHGPLTQLLGGARIYDEMPRGERPPYVAFTTVETRDWSTAEHSAHEHFVSIEVKTIERGRGHAQEITEAIDYVLDRSTLTLQDHRLINLGMVFWNVARAKDGSFGATLRFRAATEPL